MASNKIVPSNPPVGTMSRRRIAGLMSRYLPRFIYNMYRSHPELRVFGVPDIHSVPDDKIAYTYIGHATVHINFLGKRILTDPVFSKRIVVTRRLVPMPIPPAEFNPLDMVLISHPHRDHLDLPSMKQLRRDVAVVMPRGAGDFIRPLGFERIIELDTWHSADVDGMKVTSVPAQHWAYRAGKWDLGFTGYVVERGGRSFYFAGDTGYFDGFAEIGERFAPEVSLFPISCYDPAPFQRNHISPWDAVKALQELRTKLMIPIHWGTFILSLEPPEEPPKVFLDAARKAGIENKVKVLRHGEMIILD